MTLDQLEVGLRSCVSITSAASLGKRGIEQKHILKQESPAFSGKTMASLNQSSDVSFSSEFFQNTNSTEKKNGGCPFQGPVGKFC